MPIFEYKCPNCSHTFELLQDKSNGTELCYQCQHQAVRQIASSSFVFKGKDWPGKEIKERR